MSLLEEKVGKPTEPAGISRNAKATGAEIRDALAEVKVVEFGGYAAGPCISKYLANFGARVVHVESRQRPDGFRLQYPPFKNGEVGLNRSGCFAFFNDSKRGVTLDLKNDAGLELAYRLVEWSDIVIENMRPGAMSRLRLDYEHLRVRNPHLIMLSTSNMGQTGPHATHPGFGSQLSSLSGFTHLIGEPDGPPYFLYGPYIDFVAVAYGGIALLAGLDHRRRTGEGSYIDLSQFETGVQFISSAMLGYTANEVIAHRNGNRDGAAALHGCYPCRDNDWCVISCWDDQEWERFCHAAEQTAWLSDVRFATIEERKRNERELDQLIGSWTRGQSAHRLMWKLQTRGVHAAKVNRVKDLFTDPQIAFRNIWQRHEHPELGNHAYRMVSYELDKTPGSVRGAAPCLGADNEEVFRSWLGIPEREYEQLVAQGAFS